MATRFFLNGLRSKQGGLPAPDRGLWHRDADFLTRYANDVSLDGELEVDGIARSVPSVFQRPFQFLHALKHDANPLHKAIESEWRGMMALIALEKWLDVTVTATPFIVPEVSEKASSYVGNENIGNLHLHAMLRNQLPYRKIEGEKDKPNSTGKRISDWEKWWVVRCDGKLIGATSPWTMLYTASKYTAPASVRWQRNGLLIDPIAHFSSLKNGPSKPIELSILHALVTGLLNNRIQWGFPNELSTFSNLYSQLLTAWQADLLPYKDKDITLGETTSLFKEAPYCSSLRTLDGLDRHDSDLYMDTKLGPVIVFSQNTAADKRVYRSVFAGQVDISVLAAMGDSFTTTDLRTVNVPYIVAEKAFFPSTLVNLELSKDAFADRNSPNVSVPLTPAFFQYFEHKNLSWLSTAKNGGDITATLSLPLRDGGRNVAEHVYLAKDVETLVMKTPGIAVWPDFYDQKWKGGFAAYAGEDSDDLLVSPIFQSGRRLPVSDRAEIGRNQQQVRLWQCEQEPAIGFSLEWRQQGDAHGHVPAGLVLLRTLKPMVEFSERRTARIGVDFGTSSTTVMIANRDGSPVELKFGGRLVSLTDEEFGRKKEIERNLYPSVEVTPPFRTLLYEARAKQFGKQTTPYTVRFATDVKNDLLNAPIADLKWGAEAGRDGSNPLTAYLNGLVRYIVWECLASGIKHIDLSWSYPTSLPEGQLTTMKNFWISIKEPGKYHKDLTIDVDEVGMPESEAAARALAAGPAKLRTGLLTIAVDIGGGSTDIAYWSNKKFLDQVSFKLAGNDILDKALLSDKAMIAIFEAVAKSKPGNDEMASIRARPEIYLNDLLAEAQTDGDPLRHPLRNYILDGRDSVAPWQDFRSMIYLYFTGLCYYMGAQTRSLTVDKPEIDVYFGGRGASMLSWFAGTPRDIRKVLEYAFRLGLNRPNEENVANNFPGIPNVVINFHGLAIDGDKALPKLKTEVARGLLRAKNENGKNDDLELGGKMLDGVAAGETGWTMAEPGTLPPRSVSWTYRIQPNELNRLKAPTGSALESTMIGYFRYVVLEEDKGKYLSTFNLNAPYLHSLRVDGEDIEDLIQRSSEGKNKVVQPIFAYELKSLMSQYARTVSANGVQST